MAVSLKCHLKDGSDVFYYTEQFNGVVDFETALEASANKRKIGQVGNPAVDGVVDFAEVSTYILNATA